MFVHKLQLLLLTLKNIIWILDVQPQFWMYNRNLGCTTTILDVQPQFWMYNRNFGCTTAILDVQPWLGMYNRNFVCPTAILDVQPQFWMYNGNLGCITAILGVQQQLGMYNRNLHHHISTCQHQTWQRHDISSCIFVKCVGSQALTGLQDTHTHTFTLNTYVPRNHTFLSLIINQTQPIKFMWKIRCTKLCAITVTDRWGQFVNPALMWVQLHMPH